MASYYASKWPIPLDEYKQALEVLGFISPHNKSFHLLNAIYHFCNGRNIKLSIKEITLAKQRNNAAYLLSRAFIYAYEGKVDKADKMYEKAFQTKNYCDEKMIIEVETFICNVLMEEPEKVELYYCLGLINLKMKDDYKSALENFNDYISKCKPKCPELEIYIKKAESYVLSCQKKLNTKVV